jgi:vanillate O-demethylase ferredoxin subunit
VRADAGGDTPFEVQIGHHGITCTVPVGRSVIDVLAERGIEIPVSCEQGVCGTCITRVLDGEPDHRDAFLTDAERKANNCFTPCCSRARSARLVLDL